MSDIYINTDLYKKDTDVYTSLEDINGYRVFSDEFDHLMQDKKADNMKNLNAHYASIFANESISSLEEPYMTVMMSADNVIIRQAVNGKADIGYIENIMYMMAGMLITMALLIIVGRIRRNREK